MIWTHLDKYRNLGLLVLRVFFGLYLAFGHGLGKITGGPEQWTQYGGVLEQLLGFGFLTTFWGFMSAVAEFICALLVTLGLLSRPAAILVVINMLVAATGHMSGVINGGPETALLYGATFFALIFTGPGTYSLDELLD